MTMHQLVFQQKELCWPFSKSPLGFFLFTMFIKNQGNWLISYFSHYCDTLPNKGNLREEGFLFAHGLKTQQVGEDKSMRWQVTLCPWQGNGEMNAGTQFPFSFLFSLLPQQMEQCYPHSGCLSSSVKASWKHPQRQTRRNFHGDSKSNEVDIEDYSS